MKQPHRSGQVADRARRSAREIALAVALTVTALGFLLAALSGYGHKTAAVLDPPGRPASEPN